MRKKAEVVDDQPVNKDAEVEVAPSVPQVTNCSRVGVVVEGVMIPVGETVEMSGFDPESPFNAPLLAAGAIKVS